MNAEPHCRGHLSSLFKSSDLYSNHVNLYFQGQKRITTPIGRFATWVAIILMFAYSLYRGKILLSGTEFQTQTANILNPLNYSQTEIKQINEYGFDIAFNFASKFGFTHELPVEYGEVKFELVKQTFESEDFYNTRKRDRTTIEMEPCTLDSFQGHDEGELLAKGLLNRKCIIDKSLLAVGGAELSNTFQYIELNVLLCKNSSSSAIICKSQQELDEFFSTFKIFFLISNYFFDKDDTVNPIKPYVEESYYFPMISNLYQDVKFYASISEAKSYDSIWPWASASIEQFSVMSRTMSYVQQISSSSTSLLRIRILLDQWSTNYFKEVLSLTDILSEVGGMFNSIYGCGKLVVFLFADSIFVSNLLSAIFLYQDQKHIKSPNRQTFDTLDITNEIGSRKQFQISSLQFLKSFCPCYRTNKGSRASQQYSNLRLMQLFRRGKQKIKKELDIVRFLKVMREFNLLKQILLTKPQLVLFEASKRHVLDSDDSNDEQLNFSGISNLFKGSSTSSNPLVKNLQQYKQVEEIQKAIADVQGNSIGDTLIKGVFNKDITSLHQQPAFQQSQKKKRKQQKEKEKTVYQSVKPIQQKGNSQRTKQSKIVKHWKKQGLQQEDSVSSIERLDNESLSPLAYSMKKKREN